MPSSELDQVLDSNIGMGLFYRINWPWIFLTEFGGSYATYFSQTTQNLTVVPVYVALVYPLPIASRINVMLKAGGGYSYLVVRPTNRWGWDPSAYVGTEFSLLVTRRFRIGLRIDYNLVYEKHLDPPPETEWFRYLPGSTDPRYQQTNDFKLVNGHFFHFGIMAAFII